MANDHSISDNLASDVIISLRNVHNRFNRTVIHDNLSMDIPRGEILGLVGGSGTGKSVLVHSILGLNRISSGQILFHSPDGPKDIPKLTKRALLDIQKQWGVLFQNGALFSGLTVSENIQLPMIEHIKMPKSLAEELAAVKIRLVGLPLDAAVKYPSELSGGMVKRAALARALALEPQILFLDEPTSGLDPISAAGFDDLVKYLKDTLGLTIIIVTHDVDSLVTICDRIAVLVDKNVVVGTLEEMLEHPHPWIKDYFHGVRVSSRISFG